MRRFGPLAFSLIGLTSILPSGARADGYAAPGVVVAAPSPWQFEAGVRAFFSTGKHEWDHQIPGVANPASRLTWDGLDAVGPEGYFRLDNRIGFFAKGYIGGAHLGSGKLTDEDFPNAVIPYSNTVSDQHGGSMHYYTFDAGWTFYDSTSYRRAYSIKDSPPVLDPGIKLGVFTGVNVWRESLRAFGCTQTATNPVVCVPTIPSSVEGIDEDISWTSWRVGLTGTAILNRWVNLTLEGAWVPRAHSTDDDTHLLRTCPVGAGPGCLGPGPNVRLSGEGSGFQLEGVANFQLTDQFGLGVGARYWKLESSGDITFGTPPIGTLPLNHLDSSRYGVFAQGSFKLN
jgi:hypothetical protein